MNTHPVILLEPVFHFLYAVIRDYGLYICVKEFTAQTVG